MIDSEKIKKAEEFIQDHNLMVLATVTPAHLPGSSVMGFALGENLEIYFGTHNTSRKWQNLQKNPNVALVIGWEEGKTLQYEGQAKELSEEERKEAMKSYFANKPTMLRYLSEKESAMFIVKPKWLRYINMSVTPWDEFEIKF